MQTLSVPAILINNTNYSIVPNTFMYDGGEGEINVRAASGGGNNITSVHSVNAETKLSTVKFSIFLNEGVDADIATWKEAVGANVIQAIQKTATGSQTLSFDSMSLSTSVEREASADGVVALEWAGNPMAIQ